MARVIHVIERLTQGGASRAATALIGNWTRGGFEHSILSLVPAEDVALEKAGTQGVTVFDAPGPQARYDLVAEADLVIVHFWNSPGLYEWIRSPLPACRLALWIHIGGGSAPHRIEHWHVDFADITVGVSPYTLELPCFQDLTPAMQEKRVACIPAAPDMQRFKGFRRRRHEGFVVGYIGMVDQVKMHPRFLELSRAIRVPGLRIVVCGTGRDQHRMMREASEDGRFEFTGYVENLKSLSAGFDVFGYPLCEDNYAGCELILQEIMHCGIPPVILAHGAAATLVQHMDTGIIARSEQEYVRAIERLYREPLLRRRLGGNARRYAQEHFRIEATVRSWESVCDNLLARPKRRRYWMATIPPGPVSVPPGPQPAFEGARYFIQSLSGDPPCFYISMHGHDIGQLLSADEAIAVGSPCLGADAGGGIRHYARHYPTDSFLQFWSGLVLRQRGELEPAENAFGQAIELGFPHWRIHWHRAQTLLGLDRPTAAQASFEHIRECVPELSAVEGLDSALEALSPPPEESAGLRPC